MSATKLVPDLAITTAYLAALDPTAEIFTFQTFDDNKARKDPSLARVFHGTLSRLAALITRMQLRGAGVFVMVNRGDGVTHPGERTCRTTKSVVAVRALFADLDGAPIGPVIAALHPDIIVESSPGRWHTYWLTSDCPLVDFRKRQQQIASKFSSDAKVIDLPRVLRLPGFVHQKGEPFMTHMIFPR